MCVGQGGRLWGGGLRGGAELEALLEWHGIK